MGHLARGDRANLRGLDGNHGRRVSVEGDEFRLVRLAVALHVNHRSDVTRLQPFLRDSRGQHDAFVFLDHVRP